MIERAFVISLPFRKDRIDSFRRQTEAIDCLPEIEVWPAIHGDTCQPPNNWHAGAGAWGCYKSHLNILEYCLNNRVSSYVVFEDDSQFRETFNDYVPKAFEELPDDWEQLYLGGQLMHERSHPPVRYSDHLHRPFNVNRTHAFAVSRAGMLPIYKHISELPFVSEDHIDHHLGRWHEDELNKVYCLSQWQVGQHGSSSNVSGKSEKVQFYPSASSLDRDHWLFKSRVCVLFRPPTSRLVAECVDFLHFGNQINSSGFDVTLADAVKHRYPAAAMSRWYGWIRGEIAAEGSDRLPAVYHPEISEQMVRECIAETVIVLEHFRNAEEAKEQLEEKLGTIGLRRSVHA